MFSLPTMNLSPDNSPHTEVVSCTLFTAFLYTVHYYARIVKYTCKVQQSCQKKVRQKMSTISTKFTFLNYNTVECSMLKILSGVVRTGVVTSGVV